MKMLASLLTAASLLFSLTVPLRAQRPDIYRLSVDPPIKVYGTSPGPVGYTPVQLRAAYGFNRIPNQGQGQTIAIVVAYDDPHIESDLGYFDTYFHIPPCTTENGCFTKIYATGQQPQGNFGWAYETSSDVEWAHAMAPAAKIMLVEAATTSIGDLVYAEQVATTLGASQISNSWAFPEFDGETAYDYVFQIPGITFSFATGDAGHGTYYPSSSPYVVAIGGTQLALLTAVPLSSPLASNYGAEEAWVGSSGGYSYFELEQSWQEGVQQSGFRSVPDVSFVEGPVVSYDTYGSTGWTEVGGTSDGPPPWSSMFAIVNSLRAANGKGPLTQAASDLYTLYYNSTTYAQDFHDITMGSNGNCGTDCDAGPGYDLVTGIGTPIANNLVQALVAMPN